MDSPNYANVSALAPPPPGVVPNFQNPSSRAAEMRIGMGVCIGITSVMLLLRMYVKLAITHTAGWDDWTCLMGFALIVGHDAVSLTMTHFGIGMHMWDLRIGIFTKVYFERIFATLNLYVASAFFVKISIFLLYLWLFKPNRITRGLVHGGIAVCGLFYSASIIANCIMYVPKPGQRSDDATWILRGVKAGVPTQRLSVVQSAFGTLSDIYLLVIPIQMIFQLHLPFQRKVGVSAIFMIGILAIAFSLLSLVYRVKGLSIKDQTWNIVAIYSFSSAEISAGIICSCMPICHSLLRGRVPQQLNSPSLRRLYSNFRSPNFRWPFASDKTKSSNILHPNKRQSFSEPRCSDREQSESPPRGYWDVMSIFRSGNRSTIQSKPDSGV